MFLHFHMLSYTLLWIFHHINISGNTHKKENQFGKKLGNSLRYSNLGYIFFFNIIWETIYDLASMYKNSLVNEPSPILILKSQN